ncbi:hypothetical protein [Methylobacterium pseudosasicola]|uniref:Uncharacterized protein n=1 Tax=Methylobacterium pseudosasicola TaxID=582667 RepID=A0A1I4LI35_9HYPH|nr:hypothetical protein [Methylobacterium pseudosasicola]SFL90506.1 hypothetical protein SAMN05192568_1013133 [Methylobacterium pseudosasicola]
MTETLPDAFAATLTEPEPPAAWPAPRAALWWLAKHATETADATWARAHALVQDASEPDAAWVHAHLHRIEGDDGNARYWYGRAGRTVPRGTLAEERAALIAALASAG